MYGEEYGLLSIMNERRNAGDIGLRQTLLPENSVQSKPLVVLLAANSTLAERSTCGPMWLAIVRLPSWISK